MSPSSFPDRTATHRAVVISYDITDDARRERLARILLDHGVRVQYSVYECVLDDAQLAGLLPLLQRNMDSVEDRVAVYSLCGRCQKARIHMGKAAPDPDPQYLIL